MLDLELFTHTAGAYVYHNGYFLFMFGFGSNHPKNELGIVRFGGHREKGESAIQCVRREVEEEASLDVTFYNNEYTYVEKSDRQGYEKIQMHHQHKPILILRGENDKLSLMYLTYGHGTLTPKMETQGILFLRKEDIQRICARTTTFWEYKDSGGKFLLVDALPETAVLSPHTQIRFLNDLFSLEKNLMERYMGSCIS